MTRTLMSTFAVVLLDISAYTQNIVTFTVDQPAQFVVDAGQDQMFSGPSIILGGGPTATGGGEDYSYAWQPPDGLSDPASPNPTLSTLASTAVYIISVTDQSNGCVKTDEVLVTLDFTQGVVAPSSLTLSIQPNPASSHVWIRGDTELSSITIRTLTGQEALLKAYPAGRTAMLDVQTLCDGVYLLTVTTTDGNTITRKLCKAASDF